MISRFDHAVIAVRNLDAAISAYRALGFEVSPGGHHTGLGTYNAIIRFGLDYIELLALPHGKSSFVRFKPLFSSDSALVSPPRPQRRSSALEG